MSGRRSTRRGSWASPPDLSPVVSAYDAPLTIGLIADTHIAARGERALPQPVVALFRRFEVGLIAHLGDVTSAHVLDQLAEVAPVVAVRGNNDIGELAELPLRRELQIGARRLLLLHGHGGTAARAVAISSTSGYDCVIYGHSHRAIVERVNGALVVNPGSPTDRRWNPHFGLGLLHVDDTRIEPELIVFDRVDELATIVP